MTDTEIPNTPGYLISKWRKQGPVSIEEVSKWKEDMQIDSWLMICEAGLFLDAPELISLIEAKLTPAESATFGLVRRRMLGDNRLEQAIDEAIEVAKNPETRDLRLEGRLRMERGLSRFESGDTDGAQDDLTWAELRLKSVAKASRDHDLSLLNKAAFHLATGCLLYTSPSPRDMRRSRMPSSA